MAIGVGGMLAIGVMALSQSKDWFAAVLAAAGLDPRLDPITGSVEGVEWNGVLWCYADFTRWDDASKKSVGVNIRVQIVLDALVNAASLAGVKRWWDREEFGWEIKIVDGQGSLVARYEPGRKSGYLWRFEQFISSVERPENFPPLPEGVRVIYPDWWPYEALAEWDVKRSTEIVAQLTAAKEEAVGLGIRVGRNEQFDSDKELVCETCGDNLCSGALVRRGEENDLEGCQNLGDHPEHLLLRWTWLIQRRRGSLAEAEKKAAKVSEAKNRLEDEIRTNGFVNRRLDGAKLPEGCTVFSSNSFGSKSNPTVVAFGKKLTTDQFVAFVRSVGDYSEVVMEGRFPTVQTPNPARWIGSKGAIAKALSAALGIKFLKIVEKK